MALNYDKIVLFGDSITQYAYNVNVSPFCLGPALQDVYTRKFDVIQRGYGGYTSAHAKLMIDKIIAHENTPTSKVKLMTVFFGTNDSTGPSSTIQHVPLETYVANMRYIAEKCKAADIKVVFIGAGPFNAHQWWPTRPGNPHNRTTIQAREYCDALVALGKEIGVPTVPMWDLLMEAVGWKEGDPLYGLEELSAENPLTEYFVDGLHYNAKSYKIEYDGVMNAIKQAYPELLPENVPLRLPEWASLTSPDVLEKALQ
ncbi:SGNH hydrolase-type esterase domain-containing protein [Myxozyma melibiosi]|uniref:SGNH hydrolase-type esterase domain-containing protein n=1 Tax=Myxozyma melibiosi TaxID=54550 RepID=A0ABR1F8Y2_9ASCO